MHLHVYETTTGNTHVSPTLLAVRELLVNHLPFDVSECWLIIGATRKMSVQAISALVASGLPCDRFHFEGFLPHKKGRQTRLQYLAELPHTFVLYESPNRLVKCLDQLMEHCGEDRPASVARELSKLHEEVRSASLRSLADHYREQAKVKGEIVIVVGGK